MVFNLVLEKENRKITRVLGVVNLNFVIYNSNVYESSIKKIKKIDWRVENE